MELITLIENKRYFQLEMREDPSLEWMNEFVGNFTMDVPYTAIITFNNLKWTGSSNQANFKLSGSTVLNLGQNSTTFYSNFIQEVEQYSIQDLYNLVMNGTALPLTSGIQVAQEAAENLLNLSESINEFYNNISAGQMNFDSGNFAKNLDLFSLTYSLINLIKNIFKSGNKNAVTDKIYVTSNVKKIQVQNFKYLIFPLIYRFKLTCLLKLLLENHFKSA